MSSIEITSPHGLPTTPLYGYTGRPAHSAIRPAFPIHPDAEVRPLAWHNPAPSQQELVQAARQFEAYFISYLLKVMRETVPEGLVANKQGAYFHSFYDQEIGLRAAEAGGIGLTRLIEEYAEKNLASPPADPQGLPTERR